MQENLIKLEDENSNNERTLNLVEKAQNGCNLAKETLITENSPLIKSVIRRFKSRGVEYDDLYQLGSMGFLKAIKNFSPSFSVKFSTYAVPMIAGEVKRFIRDDGPIKVSRSVKSLSYKINYFVQQYKLQHAKSPEISIIATEFNIDPQEAVFIMDSSKAPISIYEKPSGDDRPSQIEKLASKENEVDNIDRIVLKDIIEKLPKREQQIIFLRYFKDKTQSAVAKVLNVSQVQVSRIETKILEKIRAGF